MYGAEYDVIVQGLRVLFLVGFPVVIVLSIAGTVISALQAATTIRDPALGYAVRLIALVLVLYMILPSSLQALSSLAEMAFR